MKGMTNKTDAKTEFQSPDPKKHILEEVERLRRENDKLQRMAAKFIGGDNYTASAASTTAAATATIHTQPELMQTSQQMKSAFKDESPTAKALKKQLSVEMEKQKSVEKQDSVEKPRSVQKQISAEKSRYRTNPDEITHAEDVPVRDTSSNIPQGSDKLKRIVSEIFARHQSDQPFVHNSNLGIDLPQPQQLLQNFSNGQQLRGVMTEPKNVNQVKRSSSKTPAILESEEDLPPGIQHVDSPDPDPFNFISTVRRKMPNLDSEKKDDVRQKREKNKKKKPVKIQDGSDLTISEGPLSTSFASSAALVEDNADKLRKKKSAKRQIKKQFADQDVNDVNIGASTSKDTTKETIRPGGEELFVSDLAKWKPFL